MLGSKDISNLILKYKYLYFIFDFVSLQHPSIPSKFKFWNLFFVTWNFIMGADWI